MSGNCCASIDDGLSAVRDVCRESVFEAVTTQLMNQDEPPRLVEAIPTIGKTTAAAKFAASLCEGDKRTKLTYLTHRRSNREQFERMVRDHVDDESDVTVTHLPILEKDCPTARGDHGEAERRRLLRLRDQGISPSSLHRNGALKLPCGGVDCAYMDWWRQDDAPDLIAGHITHAYVPEVIDDRVVIVDEDPGDAFQTRFVASDLHEAIGSYLDKYDDLPADTFHDVAYLQRAGESLEEAREELLETAREADRVELGRQVIEDTTGHVASADALRALLEPAVDDPSEHESYRVKLENGVEHARLDETTTAAYDPESGELALRHVPEFDRAAALVALDGTPTLPVWRGQLGLDELKRVRVLCDDCREQYLTDTLGYRIVRTSDYYKPYSSGDPRRISHDKDRGLLHEVSRKSQSQVGLITTSKAREELRERDDGNEVELRNDAVNHYRNIKGSNEFAGDEIEIGVVIGSPHPGPNEMRLLAGLNGDAFDTELVEEDRDGHHYSRREPRADAEPYLQHVREHSVAQAVLRFGREDGAIVFVHTAALPDWMERCADEGSVDARQRGERQVLDALHNFDSTTTTEIAEQTDYTPDTVRRHLNRMAENGLIEKSGTGHRYRWIVNDVESPSPTARVTLPDNLF